MSNNNYHEIRSCEVCGNVTLESVLNLGPHPMCDDLVSIGDDRVCNEYPIEILFCKNCNFFLRKSELFQKRGGPKCYFLLFKNEIN